jgi:hypothetical protein
MQTPKGEINDKIMELAEDEELLQKMATAASPEECYELVKDRIEGVSFEEFTASMSVAAAYAKESQSGELSEDDLDMVAGGKSEKTKTAIAVGAATGGTVASAAAMFVAAL